MKEYFKTQWCNITAGVASFLVAIHLFCVNDDLWGVAWTLSATLWFVFSVVSYLHDQIKILKLQQERDDKMYELVMELVKANKINREIMQKYETRLKTTR